MDVQNGARIAVSVFALIFWCTGCSTPPRPDPILSSTEFEETKSTPKPGTTVMEQAAIRFASDLFESLSLSEPKTPASAKKMMQSGRALLDLRCNKYIDSLGSANQNAGYGRKQVGLVGGFVSALMGLTSATPADISGVATSFSFTGASMDAYSTSMLFSDASKSVGKLVRDAQSAFILDIQSRIDFEQIDYPDAIRLLTEYEQICRPAEIRAMIDAAVEKATIVAEVPGGGDTEVLSLLTTLTAALGATVNESDAIILYSWYIDIANREGIKKDSAFLNRLNLNDPVLVSKLGSALIPLSLKGNRIAQRWANALSQVPGSKAAIEAIAANQAKAKVADEKAALTAAENARDAASKDKSTTETKKQELETAVETKTNDLSDAQKKLKMLNAGRIVIPQMAMPPILRVK